MKRSNIVLALVIGAAAVGVAGCGNDSGGAAASGPGTGVVSVGNVDGTDVLADSAGKTLYGAAVEKGGEIHCVAACASTWKPMLASAANAEKAAADVDANLGVVKRPDGNEQLTFDGLPLYTFAEEGAASSTATGSPTTSRARTSSGRPRARAARPARTPRATAAPAAPMATDPAV